MDLGFCDSPSIFLDCYRRRKRRSGGEAEGWDSLELSSSAVLQKSTFLQVPSGIAGRQGQRVSISTGEAVKMTRGENGEGGRTRTRSWTGFMALEYSRESLIILFKYFKSSSLRT